MQVVPRSREKGGPLTEECLSYPLHQGGVGVVHQGRGREGGGGQTRWELIIGIQDSPRVKGIVRLATAFTGRWILIGGTGRGVSSSSGGGRRTIGLWLSPARSWAPDAPREKGKRGKGELWQGSQ